MVSDFPGDPDYDPNYNPKQKQDDEKAEPAQADFEEFDLYETPQEEANKDNQQVALQQPKKERPQLVGGNQMAAIIPRTAEEAYRMAELFCRSGVIPKGLEGRDDQETASKMTTAILAGMEVGLMPIVSVRNIMVINGRPSVWGEGILAIIQKSGQLDFKKEYFDGTPFDDDWTAHCIVKRVGRDEIHETFSWAQAKRAKLTTKPIWLGYPERMLKMRARAFAFRDEFADVLAGLGFAEEATDIDDKPKEPVKPDFLEDEE